MELKEARVVGWMENKLTDIQIYMCVRVCVFVCHKAGAPSTQSFSSSGEAEGQPTTGCVQWRQGESNHVKV